MIGCHCGQCERLTDKLDELISKLEELTWLHCPGCEEDREHIWDDYRELFTYSFEAYDKIHIRDCGSSNVLKILKEYRK